MCSSAIAESVGTNPVVIRRMMSELEKAGLINSTSGRSGGFELSRDANNISLACVYGAVENDTVFRMHKVDPAVECPIAVQLGRILMPRLRDAELALTRSLATTKLSEVVQSVN